jgi:hypothetical protein
LQLTYAPGLLENLAIFFARNAGVADFSAWNAQKNALQAARSRPLFAARGQSKHAVGPPFRRIVVAFPPVGG